MHKVAALGLAVALPVAGLLGFLAGQKNVLRTFFPVLGTGPARSHAFEVDHEVADEAGAV